MSRHRRTYLAMAIAILIFSFVASPPGSLIAAPSHQSYCDYYSDDTYTTLVGHRWVSCSGVVTTGTKTLYKLCWQGSSCYTPPPPLCSDAPWCEPQWENCCCEVYSYQCP